MHQRLTYGLDGANNRTTTTSQTGNGAPVTATYTRQTSSPQGPSNRYESIALSATSTLEVRPEHDERGNLTYDGRFYFVYDACNRLSEVWEVLPTDVMPSTATPVPNTPPTDEKYLPIEDESLEGAREAVKLDIPNLHSRLVREHRDPQFRNRLRAQVVGGVLRITPTPASGGGRPGWLPVPAEAQLRAVYVYDAFNRRTTTVLVGDSVRYYAWDGWRNVVEAEHVYDGASPATWQAAPLKQFVWGAELDELVSYRRKVPTTAGAPAWETYFVLHGGQETAAKLVDAAGAVVEQYEYDPYGRATCYSKVAGVWTPAAESRFGLPFLWKGVRLDEVTGLLQMRNRYYSVETGRFLTRDPIGVWGDLGNLGNEYGYAWSRPLVVNDSLALQGMAELRVAVYNDGVKAVWWGARLQEGFPAHVDGFDDLIKLLDRSIEGAGGVGKACIKSISVLSHSGVPGFAAFGTSDADIINSGSPSPEQLTRLAAIGRRMCPKGGIVLRMCESGRGEEGARLVKKMSASAGCVVVAYSCPVVAGHQPMLKYMTYCGPGIALHRGADCEFPCWKNKW
jgi:RHS repeat-associated protein